MIISFIIAIPMVSLSVWLYLKFGPAGTTVKTRLGFETLVGIALLLGCLGVSYYSYATVGQGTDSAWWPVIAFLYCFISIPCMLIVSAIIRSLVYRK